MAKKTPEEIFREAQRKAQEMYGAVQDPQFQQDVVANAKALAEKGKQGAFNIGNKAGNAMEDFSYPTEYDGRFGGAPGPIVGAEQLNSMVNQAGSALKKGIYDARTPIQPPAPYVDANQMIDKMNGTIGANAQLPGMMKNHGLQHRSNMVAQDVAAQNQQLVAQQQAAQAQQMQMAQQLAAELQQMGLPVTPETMNQLLQHKMQLQQAGQAAMQGAQGMYQGAVDQASQGMEKGINWARGLLQ